eukprot:13848260-Alexandrium_andersonii.AAC.1
MGVPEVPTLQVAMDPKGTNPPRRAQRSTSKKVEEGHPTRRPDLRRAINHDRDRCDLSTQNKNA